MCCLLLWLPTAGRNVLDPVASNASALKRSQQSKVNAWRHSSSVPLKSGLLASGAAFAEEIAGQTAWTHTILLPCESSLGGNAMRPCLLTAPHASATERMHIMSLHQFWHAVALCLGSACISRALDGLPGDRAACGGAEVIEQAKVHPALVKDNARLSNPLPHMQLGLTTDGDDLESEAAAKRWPFHELPDWWYDYDRCAFIWMKASGNDE